MSGDDHTPRQRPPGPGGQPTAPDADAATSLAELREAAERRMEALAHASLVGTLRREQRAGTPETRGALGCLVLMLAPSGLVMLWIQPAIGIPLLCLALLLRLVGTAQQDSRRRRRQRADRLAAEAWQRRRGEGTGPRA